MKCDRCTGAQPMGTRMFLVNDKSICASCLKPDDTPMGATIVSTLDRTIDNIIVQEVLRELCAGALDRLRRDYQWTDDQLAAFISGLLPVIHEHTKNARGAEFKPTCGEVRDLLLAISTYITA